MAHGLFSIMFFVGFIRITLFYISGGGTQPGNMEPMQQAKPVCQFRSATISQPMSGQQLGDDQNICNSIQQLSVTPDAMPPKMLDSQTGEYIMNITYLFQSTKLSCLNARVETMGHIVLF